MKKMLFPALCIIILIINDYTFSQGFQLVWSDEFEGTNLDLSNWTRETGGGGWGNNELQYYTDRELNSYISDGILTIKALQESFGGRSYTSARLISKGKRSFRYGKIEARIKLPYGQGIWPAFWTLGENISTVGWPACGEIDIMEMIGGGAGRDNRVYGTAHWDNNGHQNYGLNYTLAAGNFSDDFHVFSITWDPQKIDWYMDGFKFCTMSITPAYLTELRENHFILLNLAVGGNWPGNPNATTVFPQTMQVDYVRVYKDTLGQPSINMVSPADGSIFSPGENITLTASTTNSNTIKKVEFYQDKVKIGETTIEPYQMIWKKVQPGCYSISAKVISLSGYEDVTDVVSLKVGNTCVQAPYKGYRQRIPGVLELEDYNIGGNGVAYNDTDAGNSGGQYRTTESVDIEYCSDIGGGYNIGFVTAGEWLKYTIEVLESTEYTFKIRAATASTAWNELQIFIDNTEVTGGVLIPSIGGWQTWSTVSAANIPLTAGEHELKVYIVSGEYNLNYIDIVKTANPYYIKLLTPNGGEQYPRGSIQEVTWESSGITNVQIGLSTNGGGSWTSISSEFPALYGECRFRIPEVESAACRIMIIDKQNTATSSTSQSDFSIIPAVGITDNPFNNYTFSLSQNYPNPFNPETQIQYELAEPGFVTLSVYNTTGEKVVNLVSEKQGAGIYTAAFNGADLPSGIYIYSLSAGNFRKSAAMLLLK